MFFIAVIVLAAGIANAGAEEWSTKCTQDCTCQLLSMQDLSMINWIKKHKKDSEYHHNHTKLRAVTCVLGNSVELDDLFATLPNDTQVLNLLESPGSKSRTLMKHHIHNLQNLIAIEIQGYDRHHVYANYNLRKSDDIIKHDGSQSSFKINYDTFKDNSYLKYLSINHVQLIPNPAEISQSDEGLEKSLNRMKRSVADPLLELHTPLRQRKTRKMNEVKFRLDKIEKPLIRQKSNSRSPINYYKLFIPENEISDVLIEMKSPVKIVSYEEYVKNNKTGKLQNFANMRVLEFLELHHCELTEFNYDLLDNLTSLRYLLIGYNHIMSLPDFAFYGTPDLTHLDIGHNNILDIKSEVFAGLLNLEYLDIRGNNVSHLSELSLPPFPKLHILDVRDNPVVHVFPNTFELLNTTKVLHIGARGTSLDVGTDSFTGLVSLETLYIANFTVPLFRQDVLSGMPSLTNLAIRGHIPQFEYDAFLLVPKLKKLILKNCSIEKMSMDTFIGLEDLLLLDLSHNRLESLPPGVFGPLASLQELHLDHNKFTTLPVDIFQGLVTKMTRLDGNPWNCDCNMVNWQATTTNKIRFTHVVRCGKVDSKCKDRTDEKYGYDESVAPKCVTPATMHNMTVYQAVRQMNCSNIPSISKTAKYKPIQQKEVGKSRLLSKLKSKDPLNEDGSMSSLSKKAQKWYKMKKGQK